MKEYRKIAKFKYKNNTYNMYLDDNNKHFFLRVDDQGKLNYVILEELFELTKLFVKTPHVMNMRKEDKIKLIPKIISGGVATVLSLTMLSACFGNQEDVQDEISYSSSQTLSEEDLASFTSVSDENKQEEELPYDTYLEGQYVKYTYIYDMDYLDLAFDHQEITLDDLHQVIDSNDSISEKFKTILYDYCSNLVQKYPEANIRILYENLKNLKIIECNKDEMMRQTDGVDSYGCYIRKTNKIYLLNDFDYTKGTWGYEVIFHELSHCLRTGTYKIDDRDVKVKFEGQKFSNDITTEAMNSLFAVSLLDYEEKDIAYQLQSNYFSIMLECMDNYELTDYVNHSQSYFAEKLNEANEEENAVDILELIQLQYDDRMNDELEVEQSEYYPIYDYIFKMYFDKYCTDDMSYQEIETLTNQLVERITYNISPDYKIDESYFYNLANNYGAAGTSFVK